MTDEKKLPWRNTGQRCDACLGFEPECASCTVCKGTGYQGDICFLVPEPEARRLHERDKKFVEYEVLNKLLMGSINEYKYSLNKLFKKVDKFELAAAALIDLYDSHALDVVATMDKRFAAKIGGIMKLLREAKREK